MIPEVKAEPAAARHDEAGFAEHVAPPSVGQRLKAERERQGLSIADVAQRLKYAARQIEAVEADDFKSLPGLTFVRGFVRGYARLLAVDADALVHALETSAQGDNGPTTVQLQGVSGTRAQFPTGATSHKSAWPWLLAILIVVGGIGGYSVYNWQAPEEFLQREAVRTAAQPTPAPAPPATNGEPGTQAAAAELPAGAGMATAPQMSEPPVVAPTETPGASTASEPANKPAPGQGRIRLVFAAESWTEVRDGGGRVVLSRNNAAGTEQWADGAPPFDLVVGNARSVRLYYNGAEVDMTPYIKVSVAKIQLK